MIWTHLDPLDLHTCEHCQQSILDLGLGMLCRVHDVIISPQDFHKVVECADWKSPYESDYRRRPDLENELKKGTKK